MRIGQESEELLPICYFLNDNSISINENGSIGRRNSFLIGTLRKKASKLTIIRIDVTTTFLCLGSKFFYIP